MATKRTKNTGTKTTTTSSTRGGRNSSKKNTLNKVSRKSRALTSSLNLEMLEGRQLMSTVNAGDFGAVANDNKDDTGAIRAALNAAKDGDKVVFGKGTYNLGSTVDVAKNVTVEGTRGESWFYVNNNTFGFNVKNGMKPTFQNLGFDGSGITYEGRSGGKVDWVTFKNFHRGVNVGFGAGTALGNHNNGFDPQGWYVTNCSFIGNGGNDFGGWGIGFWRGNGVWITDNEFINVGNGIKTNNGGATANEIHVERNYMSGIRRMNAEMQGQVTNFTLIDNYTEKTRMSSNYAENINNLGWSVIYHGDETRNVQIKRNTMYEPNNAPDGTGVRIGFETGNGAIVEDNYLVGIGTAAPVFMGDSSGPRTSAEIGNTIVRNNKLVNVKNGQGYAYGQFPGQASFSNNNANVTLTWDINRKKPGPGGGSGATGGGSTGTGGTGTGGTGTGGTGTGGTGTGGTGTGGGATGGSTPVDPHESKITLGKNDVWVSDVLARSSSNGWGDVEKDMSNGETAKRDGKKLAIRGTTYSKGMGVHASSSLTYKLAKEFSTFQSDIGVDDEAGGYGSVVFQVWGDGKLLYDSGTLNGKSGVKSIKVNVKGVTELRLVVTSPTGDVNFDHADWAGARITKLEKLDASAGQVPTDPTKPSKPVKPHKPTGGDKDTSDAVAIGLGELGWNGVSNQWGSPELNESNGGNRTGDGRTIKINGRSFATGIGATASSRITYTLGGKYQTFSSFIGLDDEAENRGTVTFEIWGDGKRLYKSDTVNSTSKARKAVVNVQGVNELWLVVSDAKGGMSNRLVHADWAKPTLLAA